MRGFRRVAFAAVAVVAAIGILQVRAGQATPHSVFAFNAPFHGSTGLVGLNQPIVGMAATPDGSGYWTVTKGGEVSPFGAARYLGASVVDLSRPVVGIAATPSGAGYWLATSDGGVQAFGDAVQAGSAIGLVGMRDIVGIAASPAGMGYWLVSAQGGVYAFGTATYRGSLLGAPLNGSVVGIAATKTGLGYWLAGRDGGVFSFGDAAFHGSMGAAGINRAAVGIARTATGNGYLFASSDGGVFAYGDAVYAGSLVAADLPEPVVGLATAATGGYWLATTGHLAPGGSERPAPDYLLDGANVVGEGETADGRPATYRQIGASAGCSYAIRGSDGAVRLSGGGSGRHVVRLRPTDTAFDTAGCGAWSTDLFPSTSDLSSPLANGTWLLGIDTRAGTWQAPGGPGCAWGRLADLSGLATGVLSAGGGVGAQVVQLAGSEVAFATQGCGSWSRA